MNGEFFTVLMADTFITMPTNKAWSTRRKAVGHMFYKERLRGMVSVFKSYMSNATRKWSDEATKIGFARINIAEEFERIHAHFMSNICFGKDLNDDRFDFFVMDPDNFTFTERKVSMREALKNMLFQCNAHMVQKFTHPIGGILNLLLDT